MKHIIYKLMLLLAVPVLTTSCIKEDYDDCDNVTIYFQYLADGNTDVLYQYMSKVDLYVFDEGGHLLSSRQYNKDELSNFAKPSFKLPAGVRYKVVAVGNAGDNTELTDMNAADFDRIFIQNPDWGGGNNEVATHDHNYLGQSEFFVASGDGVMNRDTVTLRSSHINLSVEVNGWPSPDEGMPLRLVIENANAQTSLTNKVNDEKEALVPALEWNTELGCYTTGEVPVFRMDANGALDADLSQHLLRLYGPDDELLVETSLYDYIMENDITRDVIRQEANLPIAINFKQTNIEIKLPAWYIEDVTPGWE